MSSHRVSSGQSSGSTKSTTTNYTLCNFQQWVHALDWKDLQNSMEFCIRRGNSCNITSRTSSTTGVSKATTANHVNHHCRDEYDMIQDMIRLQVPLSTPIHPRAMPYEPASKMGRYYVEATSSSSQCNATTGSSSRMKHRRWLRFIDNSAINETSEEKLWELLQQQQQNQNGPRLRHATNLYTRQCRRENKGLDGTTIVNKSTNDNNTRYVSVDIIARQFRLDDGTVLTAGDDGIRREGHADSTILIGSVIQTIPNSVNHENAGDVVVCRFNTDRIGMRTKEHQLDISSTSTCLELLRYTSRGLFATRGMYDNYQASIEDEQNTITYPPWFDPTNRWFPLSMYLTARYEIALWKSFYYWSYHHSFRIIRSLSCHPTQYEPESEIVILALSLINTMKNTLRQDEQKLLLPQSFHIRDMLIWNDLVGVIGIEPFSTTQKRYNALNLWICPILELGTMNNILRELVQEQLELVLTNRAMEELLFTDDVTGTISDETNTVSNTTKMQPQQYKKRKGKNKQKKKVMSNRNLQGSRGSTVNPTSSNNDDDHSTSNSDNETFHMRSRMLKSERNKHCIIRHHSESRFSSRQRSCHTVLALSLIEDILSIVFDHVGLNSVEANPDRVIDASTVTFKGNDHFTENTSLLAKPSVDTSPNSGDIKKKNEPVPISEASTIQHVTTNYDVWDRVVPTLNHHDDLHFHPRQNYNFYPGDPAATIRTSNLQGFSSIEYNSFTPGLFQPPEPLSNANLEIQRYLSMDGWGRFQSIGRNESILTDYFHNQDKNQTLALSSTAASIASSEKGNDGDTALEVYDFDCGEFASQGVASETTEIVVENHNIREKLTPHMDVSDSRRPSYDDEESRSGSEFHSPSPPSTPSPTLSPILVSLSELSELPTEALELLQLPSADLIPIASSEPNDLYVLRSNSYTSEPVPREQDTSTEEFEAPKLKTSTSRESLNVHYQPGVSDRATEIEIRTNFIGPKSDKKIPVSVPLKCRDDHDIIDKATVRRSADALKSYRNIVTSRSEASKMEQEIPPRELKKIPSYKTISAIKTTSVYPNLIESPGKNIGTFHFDFASSLERSRSDVDGNEDYQTLRDRSAARNFDTDCNTITKDGATTISSGTSQRESEEVAILREQRNAYRDMCLNLGSEVAMLKNVLAAQACTSFQPVLRMQSSYDFQPFPIADSFDPRVFHIAPRAQTLAAMSDAGYRGEYESLASEDEVAVRMVSNENIVHLSSGLTVNADHSRYNKNNAPTEQMNLRLQPPKGSHDVLSPNPMQSRLARDIFQFLERNTSQLRQLDGKVHAAVERMNRLVKTVWPRAQVKLYGSHVTGLSVVSSDLDFVVCLPAVHKNDIAVAPGALEGRNAINESSQKLLARRLKGESWIDPRSMKLIDRTAVPVIKVSTKDTKKYTLHLDISFDGPGHHGLEAAQMISSIMNELPMLRPLVVVLKQFLIERSLLEAYTGGISSYGLSLMVARYLQEQSSGADVGSLLMGFLDFYGNHFDPRSTGISVRKRQYFARPNYYTSRNQGEAPMWGPTVMGNPPVAHIRRNSVSDKESTNIQACRRTLLHMNPHQHPAPPPPPNSFQTAIPDERNSFDNGMPYTFDPLFVEDPLSSGNNVGRNSFRIFQVQRAFSDAHRALVAALEWEDIYSSSGADAAFPLLKCLLHSEDVVYDL